MYKLLTIYCLYGIFIFFNSSCAVNPISGKEQLMFYSVEKDFKIGKAVAPEIEKLLGNRINSPKLQRYIDRVGQKIAGVCHHPDWQYHYTAVKHKSVNALALPGGFIFITRGMLENITNEAELAAVLAHETTHAVARHAMAQLSKQTVMQLATLATLVSKQAPAELQQLALISNQFLTLQYSRDDEQQADTGGLRYMVEAGYDPNSMIELMQMLYKEHPGGKQYEFYSTHPHPTSRLHYIKAMIKRKYKNKHNLKIGKKEYQDNVLNILKKKVKTSQ